VRTIVSRPPLLAAVLVAGAACWLIPVRLAGADPSPTLGAWIAGAIAALVLTALLIPHARRAAAALTDRPGTPASPTLEGASIGLAAALGAGFGAVLADAVAGTLGRELALELVRDVSLAAFVTAPLALVTLAGARAAAPVKGRELATEPSGSAPARALGSTRRGFLKAGAGGVAVAAVARSVPVAAAAEKTFHLTITDGDIHMIDEVPVFCRTFAGTDGKPQMPGPFIGNPGPFDTGREVLEGDDVLVTVTNLTPRDHTFLIESTGSEEPTRPVVGPVTIPQGGIPVEIRFKAPDAGTYIYRDADRNNRILGMHGVMVVMPGDGSNRPYTNGTPGSLTIPSEFLAQYVWVLHDIDPLLGEYARARPHQQVLDFPFDKITPRYFTINGVSGVESTESLVTVPVFPVQDTAAPQVGTLIRVVNTGVASHSPHWHGNHVFVVMFNERPSKANFVIEKDVMRIAALQRVAVLLPVHSGLDAWPPLDPKKGFEEQEYPMHCHAEMSQTAAGGLYPMGMLTDWRLVSGPQDVAAARARVRSGHKTRRVKAQIARARAANAKKIRWR